MSTRSTTRSQFTGLPKAPTGKRTHALPEDVLSLKGMNKPDPNGIDSFDTSKVFNRLVESTKKPMDGGKKTNTKSKSKTVTDKSKAKKKGTK